MVPESLLIQCDKLLGSPVRETGTRYPVCPPLWERIQIFRKAFQILESCCCKDPYVLRFSTMFVLNHRRLVTLGPCTPADNMILAFLRKYPHCIPVDCFIGQLPWNDELFLQIADIRGGYEYIESAVLPLAAD